VTRRANLQVLTLVRKEHGGYVPDWLWNKASRMSELAAFAADVGSTER